MGNLRDQLSKARLLSQKDAKRLAHEERVHTSKAGGQKGLEKEQAARAAELQRLQEEQRVAIQKAQAEREALRAAAAERAACEELLRREVRQPGRAGASRWHFRLDDGHLPFLDLPAQERVQLQDGTLYIVRIGPPAAHHYALIAAEHGRRIAKALPDRVAWANVR